MPIGEALLPELDQEAAATRKVLERVPEDKLGWKPHEKSMTMGRLATHLTELPGWVKLAIDQDEIDIAPSGEPAFTPQVVESVSAMVELFDRNVAETRALIGSTPDDTFMKPWTMKKAGEEVFTAPKIGVIRHDIMNHLIHHRGQLTVYLRLSGVSVPSTYGPTADEPAL
ncbi:MAG: DUF664 domain-containing protein [Gemmatimonadales bacterium]|nr:DUF664 domain-containing protein [Gemmatimonadales bacterium]NIN12160.1 DUF664 domain-containing protein [Gemmatimonadales bacterium]NIN50581.1 DUF664 domain-containing protein [Gemmatimonadales bacterium]NIP08045.1 DUF664 domain-containing protein [Gemmatimonadales bacterium]NIR00627.1 DUF664 domain-containing protein [Gemmatimonadales bacterium]